jgi:hypothetical protein
MILGARLFPKLSNEYSFVKNGFLNLLEFKFENHIWNKFWNGGKNKNQIGSNSNRTGPHRRIPERAGPNTVSQGGRRFRFKPD